MSNTTPPAYSPTAASPERTQWADTDAPGRTQSFWASGTISRGWHSSTSPMGVETVTLRNLVRGSIPKKVSPILASLTVPCNRTVSSWASTTPGHASGS